ncbi:YbhB/YbcL family Raf kinase inhibitor-like protein [Pseudomonas chlororaphis]|uniref:YbhB/YbcL family Raf kinase inhibitor-like protein n=1 Tax=Pseudomonas chlororaphis TaxID=587753 RepID=UPI001E5B8485|nr:YbhB/YbcL family Raf kinase inhibitor-like protein [Pseudomonas chlororaphis]MCB2255148.1 YbhB/YbcL family Raf kinase inhibitor-like protein [Pseudomonas chlororaphis]
MKKLALGIAVSLLSLASQAQSFQIRSTDIQQGHQLDNRFVQNGSGCSGADISPQLSWSGEPAGTKSFAITVYDPDAPTGSGWWHWTVVNIPRDVHGLEQGAGDRNTPKVPAGAVQGRTDFGSPGYGGACPPMGDKAHRYHFKVWALKVDKLPVTAESSGAVVGALVIANSLGSAQIVALSKR